MRVVVIAIAVRNVCSILRPDRIYEYNQLNKTRDLPCSAINESVMRHECCSRL